MFFRKLSTLKPIAIAISSGSDVVTTNQATKLTPSWKPWHYIILFIVLWPIWLFLIYGILCRINCFLIRIFGRDELRRQEEEVIREAIGALLDRREINAPTDEDLVKKEAWKHIKRYFEYTG